MLPPSHAWRSVRHGGELSNWSANDEGTNCESCARAETAMRANNKAGLIRIVADIGFSPDGSSRPCQHQEKSGATATAPSPLKKSTNIQPRNILDNHGRKHDTVSLRLVHRTRSSPLVRFRRQSLKCFKIFPGSNIKGCAPPCQEQRSEEGSDWAMRAPGREFSGSPHV